MDGKSKSNGRSGSKRGGRSGRGRGDDQKASHRRVERNVASTPDENVVKPGAPKQEENAKPFESSLQRSLQKNKANAASGKQSTDNEQAFQPTVKRQISLTDVKSNEENVQPFESSLAKSAAKGNGKASNRQDKSQRPNDKRNGDRGQRQNKPDRSQSRQRKNSTESVNSQRSEQDRGGRWDRRNGGKREDASRSTSRQRSMTRKDSTDSVHGQRSEYDRMPRWDNGKSRQDGSRSRSRQRSMKRRDSSESISSQVSEQDQGGNRRWVRRGGRDQESLDARRLDTERFNLGRFADENKSGRGGVVGRWTNASRGENTPPASSSLLRSAASSQDVRYSQGGGMLSRSRTEGGSAMPPTRPPTAHKTASMQDIRVDSGSTKPFASSFQKSLNGQTSDASFAEDRRRQATERLKQGTIARNLSSGKSLSDMLHSTPESTPVKPEKTDKDRRRKEFYEKVDAANAKQENAQRATPFKSSLLASLSSSQPKEKAAPVQKVEYSILDLRTLKPVNGVRPSNLPDMTIVRVIEERAPGSRPVPSRTSRLARGSKSSGRRNDGSDARKQTQNQNNGRNRNRQGQRSKGGRNAPQPPLFDGPVEPLPMSENRWQGKKAQSTEESVLSSIKGKLNKLTREKFDKLTREICSVEFTNYKLLEDVVAVIMDKALAEPNFADVYADLCKAFHLRTRGRQWQFLVLAKTQGSDVFWAVKKESYDALNGPMESVEACVTDAQKSKREAQETVEYTEVSNVQFFVSNDQFVVVGVRDEKFFYLSRPKSELSDSEPLVGPYKTKDEAMQSAVETTSFQRLLVTRCQHEFEKANKRVHQETEEEDVDARRKEIRAMQTKRLMLGNIRFIAELYKVDMLHRSVVQDCMFYLLGLELVPDEKQKSGFAGQTVRFPDEEDVEALCKLLSTAGKKFDQPETQHVMELIILRLVELSEDKNLPSRARFLVKDVLEMRDHMWEPRRKELQQKTLEEVRREAQKLQRQGKNAQHDDLARRRRKTNVTSAELAKRSSSLLVHKETPVQLDAIPADEFVDEEEDREEYAGRIKNTIQEYLSILDLDEAATCVSELPSSEVRALFVEEVVNVSLEGKMEERENVVDLLTRLYECGVVDAPTIQTALRTALEFLEDMSIDIPLVHQYSALVFGRLLAAGCFGLSWMVTSGLNHVVECGLLASIFPEVLTILENESDEQSVRTMITDEEIDPKVVLPSSKRTQEGVDAYLREHDIEDFFSEEEELDPEVAGKMRSTLVEYLSVYDENEVVACVHGYEQLTSHAWRHFIHIVVMYGVDSKEDVRRQVAQLVETLVQDEHVSVEDVEVAVAAMLVDYEDLRVDIPKIGMNVADLLAPLFARGHLSIAWLRDDGCQHLIDCGYAAEVLEGLLNRMEALMDSDKLKTWWQTQDVVVNGEPVWEELSKDEGVVDERLSKWQQRLA